MNERSGLERLAGSFVGELAQFFVDQGSSSEAD
jgi:hypothetical protein